MEFSVAGREERRMALQRDLDSRKDQADRNRMGQFATPAALAVDLLRYAKERIGETEPVRFIDPAIGTGSFYSALLAMFPGSHIAAAVGYEVDRHYGEPAARLWRETGLQLRIEDFTRAVSPQEAEKFDLLICNPPYVRHHHIPNQEKRRLQAKVLEEKGIAINGLAGLYCYFLLLCDSWMADGALAGWLVPSEFMDVNYGSSVKNYLLDKVTLMQVHRFDPCDLQFGDALVSSVVVWFNKRKPPRDHAVRFTYGGALRKPKVDRRVAVAELRRTAKWTRFPLAEYTEAPAGPVLGDFFDIRRGIATGGNKYFILTPDEIAQRGLPIELFRPILPSPRYVLEDEIATDGNGNPVSSRPLFLLDCRLTEEEIRQRYPSLWSYLEAGRAQGVTDGHICRHRTPWYSQERRAPAPVVCTYLGRNNKKGRPFRFILNHSRATAPNVYLMLYPKGPIAEILEDDAAMKREVWRRMNEIQPEALLGEGRVYGGGLYKLEPKELANVPAASIAELLPRAAQARGPEQGVLFR